MVGQVLEAAVTTAELSGITFFAIPEFSRSGIAGFFDDLAVLFDGGFVDTLDVLQVGVDVAEDRVKRDEAIVLREQVLFGLSEAFGDDLFPGSPVLDEFLGGRLGLHALGGGFLEHRGFDCVGEAELGVEVGRLLRVARSAELALPGGAGQAVDHLGDVRGLDGVVLGLGDLVVAGAIQLDHEVAGQVGAHLLHRVVDKEELFHLGAELGVLEDHDRELVLEQLVQAEVFDGDLEAVGAVLAVHDVEFVAVGEDRLDAVLGRGAGDLLTVAEQDAGRHRDRAAFGDFVLQERRELAGALLVQLALVALLVLRAEDVDLEARDELVDGDLAGVDGTFGALVDFDQFEDHGVCFVCWLVSDVTGFIMPSNNYLSSCLT